MGGELWRQPRSFADQLHDNHSHRDTIESRQTMAGSRAPENIILQSEASGAQFDRVGDSNSSRRRATVLVVRECSDPIQYGSNNSSETYGL